MISSASRLPSAVMSWSWERTTQMVWTLTGNGELAAHDYSGKKIWGHNIQDVHGAIGTLHMYSNSPVLAGDRLIITVMHGMKTDEPSFLFALNKKTGEPIWKTERRTDAMGESPDSYATPTLLEIDGRTEVIVNGADVVTGHDAVTGEELWRCEGLNPDNAKNYRIISSCLVAGDLIIAPTRLSPMLAIRTGGKGDISSSHVAWTYDGGPDVPTPVSDGETLWVLNDKLGIIRCLDLQTGEEVYEPQRIAPGTYSASPLLADGKIYCTNEEGVTTVLEASREFKILATNRLDDSYTLSSIAVAGGQFFVRTGEYLYCIEKPSS